MEQLTSDILKELIDKSYATAKKQGFYADGLPLAHHLMMIVSEMGEAIQADRRNRHGSIEDYESYLGYSEDKAYERALLDTVESELGDVSIRIMSLIGYCYDTYFKIEPLDDILSDGTLQKIIDCNSVLIRKRKDTLTTFLFHLVKLIACSELDATPNWLLAGKLQNILCQVFSFAVNNGIDLMKHIRLKMEYNEYRENLHGYKY